MVMASAYSKMLATNIRIDIKHALRIVPLTDVNNRLLDLLDQIDMLASQIEGEEGGHNTSKKQREHDSLGEPSGTSF